MERQPQRHRDTEKEILGVEKFGGFELVGQFQIKKGGSVLKPGSRGLMLPVVTACLGDEKPELFSFPLDLRDPGLGRPVGLTL
jgi:hypothetical protein